MPKYNESTITGESWRRSFQLFGINEYGSGPEITFNEEDVVLMESGKLLKSFAGKVGTTFTAENATTQFQLRNPASDEYIDQYSTYQDVFVLLHSLYFHLAKERDKGQKPFPSWIWSEESNFWIAPIPKPEGDWWSWDESNQSWFDYRPPKPDQENEYQWVDGGWELVSAS